MILLHYYRQERKGPEVVFSRQLTFFISSIIDWEYDLAASEFFWYTYYKYNRRCRYEDVFFSI